MRQKNVKTKKKKEKKKLKNLEEAGTTTTKSPDCTKKCIFFLHIRVYLIKWELMNYTYHLVMTALCPGIKASKVITNFDNEKPDLFFPSLRLFFSYSSSFTSNLIFA